MKTSLQTHKKTRAQPPVSSLTRLPTRLLQRQCGCGGIGGLFGECESCRKEKLLPSRAVNAAPVPEVPSIVHEALHSPGRPLDSITRAFMEPRFGYDFSQVRVHSDAKAAESARAVNALAYTVGRHVVFATGQYQPESPAGQRLLAHELTHVMQQGGQNDLQSKLELGAADDDFELEAEKVADSIISSQAFTTATVAGKQSSHQVSILLAYELTLTHVVQQTARHHQVKSPLIQRFTTNEHKEIGNAAYELVQQGFTAETLKNSALADTLRRGSRFRLGERVKTYGDIIADGDFFDQFEELIKEEGKRPDRAGMAALAARNITHFTPNNIKLWEVQHAISVDQMLFAHQQLAFVSEWLRSIDYLLDQAREAILKDDDATADRLVMEYRRRFEPQQQRMETMINNAHELARQALTRNAFADHFLTDAFSAGHIITPRAEILKEAGVKVEKPVSTGSLVRGAILGAKWGELADLRAQALSLAWHDLDNYYGIEVSNASPGFAPWVACGDSCSERTGDSHWQATRAMVIRAASESIKHLWLAGLTGVHPDNYRSVLDLVPRPTWRGYPAWGKAEWENQLGYIRGDSVPHNIPGEQMTPFAVELHPIEHCSEPTLGCYGPYVGTSKDWIQQHSFDGWVRPWIGKIKASAAERYNF